MRILLVQLSFLGDCILTTPLIQTLKTLYPNASLSLLTTPLAKDLYAHNPLVDSVITFDKRKSERGFLGLRKKAAILRECKFDKVYSVHRSGRTALLLWLSKIPVRIGFCQARWSFLYTTRVKRLTGIHDVERNLSLIQAPMSYSREMSVGVAPHKTLSEPVRAIIDSGNYVVLFPGSAWKTKQWKLEGFREVAQTLGRDGFSVIVLGAPSEVQGNLFVSEGLPSVRDLTGKTSLSETIALVASSQLLVCNDSMSLHLGSTFKIPTVVVFCATSPTFGFGPWQNPRAEVVEDASLYCKPCRRHGSMKCPSGTEACSKAVSSTQVLNAIRRVVSPCSSSSGRTSTS
jgi:heptosyltransferase II